MWPIRAKAQTPETLLTTTIWRHHSAPLTFPAFDGPATFARSFQLTSRLLCRLLTALWRSAPLARRSLRGAWPLFVSPSRRAPDALAATTSGRGIDKPVASLSGAFLAEPGALPGFSRLLSSRNHRTYAPRRCPFGPGNWDFRLCCTLVPRATRLYPPTGRQFARLHCSFGP